MIPFERKCGELWLFARLLLFQLPAWETSLIVVRTRNGWPGDFDNGCEYTGRPRSSMLRVSSKGSRIASADFASPVESVRPFPAIPTETKMIVPRGRMPFDQCHVWEPHGREPLACS